MSYFTGNSSSYRDKADATNVPCAHSPFWQLTTARASSISTKQQSLRALGRKIPWHRNWATLASKLGQFMSRNNPKLPPLASYLGQSAHSIGLITVHLYIYHGGALLAPDDYMQRAGNWSDSIVINRTINMVGVRAVANRSLVDGLQP